MTSGDQRDDFMMRCICAHDLRHEMAHMSQCGLSMHKKDRQRTTLSTRQSVNTTICGHSALIVLCQARHFHRTRLACFTQADASCLKHFLKVKVPSTVPYDEVRLVDVLLSGFLMYQLIRLHTFFLNLWNGNIDDLIQSSRFPGTYGVNQIQQLKHRLCMLLYHASANHRSCESYTQVRQSHGFSPR